MKQEVLAHAIDISVRHFSFLETGRAHPSRSLIERLVAELRLGRRDSGNLLLAAGFLPKTLAADLDGPGNEELRLGLVATLRCFDPFPAAIIDPFANVKMVNRAWVHAHKELFGARIMRPDINTIELLIDPAGWRSLAPDWADTACLYLVILQQEAILRDSPEAQRLLDAIIATPGVPRDWARRGAGTPSDGHNHRSGRHDTGTRMFINVHHTVGSTAFVSEPRLILHAIVPEDGVPDLSLEELHARDDLAHPLCPY